MRIAYIAPYQGPGLLKNRPILRNLGLAANVKMELVAELLRERGHDIELLSQGAVVESRAKHYRAFRELEPFDAAIPVFYASAVPVPRINGVWSALQTFRLFRRQHRNSPFDIAIIYNLQLPQAMCALYARRVGIPIVLEYEDDALVNVAGTEEKGWNEGLYLRLARAILKSVSGCICVSPHLLSQMPIKVPRVLLRGVVSGEILALSKKPAEPRRNWIVFSGTHFRTKGIEQLVQAWDLLKPVDWELHIAGHGEKTEIIKDLARDDRSIVFHGLLNREANARLLSMTKIGMNPHDLSAVPGNVFAFKIIEYLAAGNHVITTPMGALEKELEGGITYIPDNFPQTIAAALRRVFEERLYERTATAAAQGLYGPAAVAKSLDGLLEDVAAGRARSLTALRVSAES